MRPPAHLALRRLARISELPRMPGMLANARWKGPPNRVVVAARGIHSGTGFDPLYDPPDPATDQRSMTFKCYQ
jgi:hypothetical protein